VFFLFLGERNRLCFFYLNYFLNKKERKINQPLIALYQLTNLKRSVYNFSKNFPPPEKKKIIIFISLKKKINNNKKMKSESIQEYVAIIKALSSS